MSFDSKPCPASTYLQREAESLVIGGYRGWASAMGAPDMQEKVRRAHIDALGPVSAGIAIDGLDRLINQLGVCATCPLRFFPQGSHHLCRDECLLLAMLAGAQHGDENLSGRCAMALTCSQTCQGVVAASNLYATALKYGGATLLPVPASVVDTIVDSEPTPDPRGGATVH